MWCFVHTLMGSGNTQEAVPCKISELAEDQSSVPRSHYRWLTTSRNSGPIDLMPTGLRQHLRGHGAHTLVQTYTHIAYTQTCKDKPNEAPTEA